MNKNKANSATELPTALMELLNQAQNKGKKVVLATGVFDIIHQEHKNFLQKAQVAGDILIVGIESDVRVREIKGEGRPVNVESTRQENLEKLGIATYVFILPDEFSSPEAHRNLIKTIKPNVLAVSSHTKHLDKKQAIVAEFGGTVEVVHEHNPNISTTLLLQQQKE